jgi:outer membrane protein OmpA-like peptidoglycan-associated protein
MNKTILSLVALLGFGLGALPAWAQTAGAGAQLSPQDQRISDAVIHADHQTYLALQERIHQLNEHGVALRDYHLSKAQCWLDVSLHEYTRNDRSAFPQEALTESEKLVVGLENKTQPATMETPLVNGATRLRPDLWARTGALKQDRGFQCAWQQVACAEVELVHAGNEFNQQQWRHARPYVQIAEDLLAQADGLVAQCPLAPVAPAPVVVFLPEALAPVAVSLSAQVLFDFDQSSAQHIRSLADLDALVAQVRREGIQVESLRLTGHADRLSGPGSRAYNRQLSQKRADTVRALLQARGLTAPLVLVDARGDAQQIETCQRKFKNPAQLQDCLLPNRRVLVEVQGIKAPASR